MLEKDYKASTIKNNEVVTDRRNILAVLVAIAQLVPKMKKGSNFSCLNAYPDLIWAPLSRYFILFFCSFSLFLHCVNVFIRRHLFSFDAFIGMEKNNSGSFRRSGVGSNGKKLEPARFFRNQGITSTFFIASKCLKSLGWRLTQQYESFLKGKELTFVPR